MSHEEFINLMLENSKKKYEDPEPNRPLAPEKEPESNERTTLTEEEEKEVEEYTKALMENLQR